MRQGMTHKGIRDEELGLIVMELESNVSILYKIRHFARIGQNQLSQALPTHCLQTLPLHVN